MTIEPQPDPRGLGLDAVQAFRWPLLIVGALSGVAGALDAVAFANFGVFTANQAGNLVLVWVRLPTEPDVALLSLASIVGSALGIALVVWRRMRAFHRGRTPHPRTTLIAALVVVAAATILIEIFSDGSPTWQMSALVVTSAFGLGILGASVMVVNGHQESVIGSGGAYLTAIRMGVVRLSRGDADWRDWWSIAVIPVCWSAGAALTALTNPTPIVASVAVCLLFIGVLFSLRRVASHPPQ